MSARRTNAQRRETFGFETTQPWALDALRLVCNTPRVYPDLLQAWERCHPGSTAAVTRLTTGGFIDYQPAVIVNTITKQPAARTTPPSSRYRLTTKGRAALERWTEDIRYFDREFPYAKPANAPSVVKFVAEFNLQAAAGKVGMSLSGAVAQSGIAESAGKWWLKRLVTLKYLKLRPEKVADVRKVVPEHWRVNSKLRLQLKDTLEEFGEQWGHLVDDLQAHTRKAALQDVDPAQITLMGASSYTHDVNAASIAGALVESPLFTPGTFFRLEGVHNLGVHTDTYPWVFDTAGSNSTGYQPDVELRATEPSGMSRRVAVEYERYQSRADGWEHLEKFLGWVHLTSGPDEVNDCLFVVDTDRRLAAYLPVLEAFVTWVDENPLRAPRALMRVGITTESDLKAAADPLDVSSWTHLVIEPGEDTQRSPVLHRTKRKASKKLAVGGKRPYSPFYDYFERK